MHTYTLVQYLSILHNQQCNDRFHSGILCNIKLSNKWQEANYIYRQGWQDLISSARQCSASGNLLIPGQQISNCTIFMCSCYVHKAENNQSALLIQSCLDNMQYGECNTGKYSTLCLLAISNSFLLTACIYSKPLP